jgi:hypothetical protein
MITLGDGRTKVFLEVKELDDDLILILSGGEKSHVGGVVICEPGKKVQMISLPNHSDYVVLKPLAENACKKFDKKVIALGGIHIDNATKDEIDIIIRNCENLIKHL